MKQKFANALSLALIVAMLFTSVALADNLVADGDGLVPLEEDTVIAFGNVCSGETYTANVLLGIKRTGGGNVYADGASITTSVGTVTGTGLSATLSDSSIALPSDWTDVDNNTFSDEVSNNGTALATVKLVASGNSSGSATFSATGARDGSGSLTRSVTVNVTWTVADCTPADTTAPVITPNVVGTLGNNGWYTSDVTVSWTVVDNESAISSSSGCETTTINTDTAGTTLTCSATSAGGTDSQSVTIKRDATAPTISGSASPAPNGARWNNSDVAVTFTCDDNLSGVVSCGPNSTLNSDGSGLSVAGTVVDDAGNSASTTVSGINLDKTAPTISGAADRGPNGNGWYNADVTVTFICTDGGSGVASCSGPSTLGEGANQSVTGTATDSAGNSNTATVSGINIDKTAPTATATASPAANSFGWNNTDVTVSFIGLDALSGIDACSDDVTFTNEGANQSASGTCTDNAGNESAPTSATVNIDKTAPSVSLVGGSADGGTYYFGFVPAAPTCLASDALSGLDGSCSVSEYGTGLGSHTVTASATDKAGNEASASAAYTVLAWDLRGFYQPVDMNDVLNTVKGGSTVPLKFEIFAGSTELTDVAIVSTLAKQVTCNATAEDTIEAVATGGTNLRYDLASGQFIFNWQTPKLPGKCYSVTMTTQDGSTLVAFFKLK